MTESEWKAISDSSRRKILLLLMERDMTPTEISRYFQFTMPAVSVHLRILKNSDLILENKIGKEQDLLFEQGKGIRNDEFFCRNVGL